MGKGKKKVKKYKHDEQADEGLRVPLCHRRAGGWACLTARLWCGVVVWCGAEHMISAVAQLFMHLSDVRYARLLNKFQENEFEKIERLIELHEKYYKRVCMQTSTTPHHARALCLPERFL